MQSKNRAKGPQGPHVQSRDAEVRGQSRLLQLIAIAFAGAGFCGTAALAQSLLPPQGRPVTAKDIVGKKICWDNGRWGLYAANGEFSNDRHGGQHHKWSVPEPGVIQTGDYYRQVVVLPDGSFVSYSFKYRAKKRPSGPMVDHSGTVC
jgi:hypothetical protein